MTGQRRPLQVRPLRVLLLASAIGIAGGIALSFHRQAQRERELEALADIAAKIGAAPEPEVQGLPPPGKNLQLGTVHLEATRGLPPYPNAFVRPMLSSESDGGLGALELAWFGTPDSVGDVLAFYRAKFTEAGYLAVTHQYSESAGYSGYLNLGDGRLHLIAVLRDHHQTLVFPSSSDPEALLHPAAAGAASGVPTIPGAQGELSFALGAQAGPLKRLWVRRYPGASVAGLVDAYRESLSREGWQVQAAEAQGPKAGHVQAKRPDGAQLDVTLQRDAKATVAVYLSVSGA